jgi:hypothetical protein
MQEDEMMYTEGGYAIPIPLTDAQVKKAADILQGGGDAGAALAGVIAISQSASSVIRYLGIISGAAWLTGAALKLWNSIDGIKGGTVIMVNFGGSNPSLLNKFK